MVAAATRQDARFSITARQDPAVRKAIVTINNNAWTPIKYTNAVFDADQQRWISDAEVAEILTWRSPPSARISTSPPG